ncbi:hypothetical protein LshimejAT787_0204320 [Lyophyllum shimeji]|uniref:RRN6 K-rich C-terminal domain-containing protein n=1 Tax=Lyophyllum shimeji TaxID=47721 RepID=A0A9P3PF64_LYOSH|nr:hypothetical protein LshimejAT787_0204320 [Lyophyllum shimeji]
MDSWPVDERTQIAADSGRKGKTKHKHAAAPRHYLDLERGANAITLVERDGRMEWVSVAKSGHQGLNQLHMGKYTTIFPATRPPVEPQIKATILQKAERGANFLRTFLPEVDIPAELIREEVTRDAELAQELDLFDPYQGNILEPVVTSDSTFLAFPMGELNRDLNLSPFVQAETAPVFKPCARPTRTFDTPIRQISASLPPGSIAPRTTYMAVRTFSLTSLLEVNTSKTTPHLAEVATISPSDTANRGLVDIKLFSQPFEALAVTEHGSVYRCSVFGGQKTVDLVKAPDDSADGDTQDSFWRLARGAAGVNYFLASKDALTQFDLRTKDFNELFTLPGPRDVITSVEDQGDDYILKLCSTREILWVDTRFPGKPLLGYKHGRQYDRYLEVWTSPLSRASTLLTSRNNGMVTVYDVFRSQAQLLHLDSPPYCIIPGNHASVSHPGQALFKPSLGTSPDAFSLIRLTEQGSLSQVDLHLSDAAPAAVFETTWMTDVKEMESRPLRTKLPLSENQEFTETDLSSAYDYIFRDHAQDSQKLEEDQANAVHDLLETIPTFWQNVEVPVEHMLTTYDMAFRAGDELIEAARADFLTESVMNSTRGYRAMVQAVRPHLFGRRSKYHDSPEYEKEAREQVALDLALSADVFSSQPFSKSSDDGLELEAMTKTLSLAGEPAAVEFGYLRPQVTRRDKAGENTAVIASIGVRSLLNDWKIGADPEDFVFVNHHEDNGPAPEQIRWTKRIQKEENPGQPAGPQSQRPPTILPASTLPSRPPEIGRRILDTQSQGSVVPLPRMAGFGSQIPPSSVPQSSQEYMTSTQILPGAHGGRPAMPKKKVAKKRVGGF